MICTFMGGGHKQTKWNQLKKTMPSLLKPVLSLFDQKIQGKNIKTKEAINNLVYNFTDFVGVVLVI